MSLDATARATLAALADCIFPATEDCPSASDLGVVTYVERHLASLTGRGERTYAHPPYDTPADSGHGWQLSLSHAEVYECGLTALDAWARETAGAAFAELAPERRAELAGQLADGSAGELGGVGSRQLFALVREHVLEGVFGDPRHGGNRDGAAWRWLGYPGPPALATDLSLGARA